MATAHAASSSSIIAESDALSIGGGASAVRDSGSDLALAGHFGLLLVLVTVVVK